MYNLRGIIQKRTSENWIKDLQPKRKLELQKTQNEIYIQQKKYEEEKQNGEKLRKELWIEHTILGNIYGYLCKKLAAKKKNG